MDILSFILGYQKGKSQGSGGGDTPETETDIFPLQTVSGFVEDTQDLVGTYGAVSPITFEIKEGEAYYVEWDGETYQCKGIMATLNEMTYVYLGNGSMLGYEGNNEPFAIIYLAGVGNQLVAFESTAPSHDIRVYQIGESENGGVSIGSFDLKEILPETSLTFAVGNSGKFPNTPTAMIADANAVGNGEVEVINDGESGVVIWDGALYAVYAGLRYSPPVKMPNGNTNIVSISNSVGNISIPSAFAIGDTTLLTVIEDTKNAGKSNEPFFVVANNNYGFVVCIPEDSEVFTHTIQIYKFVDSQNNVE